MDINKLKNVLDDHSFYLDLNFLMNVLSDAAIANDIKNTGDEIKRLWEGVKRQSELTGSAEKELKSWLQSYYELLDNLLTKYPNVIKDPAAKSRFEDLKRRMEDILKEFEKEGVWKEVRLRR